MQCENKTVFQIKYGGMIKRITSFVKPFMPVVFNLGDATPEGSWTIFGGVANRYFMYTAVLHMLYSSFKGGRLVIVACYNESGHKKVWKHCILALYSRQVKVAIVTSAAWQYQRAPQVCFLDGFCSFYALTSQPACFPVYNGQNSFAINLRENLLVSRTAHGPRSCFSLCGRSFTDQQSKRCHFPVISSRVAEWKWSVEALE